MTDTKLTYTTTDGVSFGWPEVTLGNSKVEQGGPSAAACIKVVFVL